MATRYDAEEALVFLFADNMSIQPFEDFDIAESEEDSEDDISSLPGESLVDDPSARPSLLLRDPDMNITLEEEDLPIPPPPPVAVVGAAGDVQPAPPQETPGSTTDGPGTSSAPPPTPLPRPATPPPVLDATSRADFKQRCEARKAALGGYNKKLSPQEAHEKWTLLVEDNEDRSNCLGEWLWKDFTEDVPFINENVNFAFETQGLSQAAKGQIQS
ncbi:uncharacterized protein [Apostichopus japonicus]|uniref:uncharacterized protein n=1 Tax=Stichopus japonicus TaxID=307972 RepID=UPI003AB25DD5